MTVLFWRLICYVSAGVFATSAILLLCLHLLRNRYYHSYHDDELIKKERTDNSHNSLYFTHGETRKYIKKYVICKTVYDKFLVCNFVGKMKTITYFVMQYSRSKKPVSVVRVDEKVSGDSSKVIALDRRCEYVNVVVGTVDGLTLNAEVIRPLSVAKIRLYSFLKSIVLFAGLMALRHVAVELIAGQTYLRQFLNDIYNYIAVAASFALSFILYFISVKAYRVKNCARLSGGNLVYDFL